MKKKNSSNIHQIMIGVLLFFLFFAEFCKAGQESDNTTVAHVFFLKQERSGTIWMNYNLKNTGTTFRKEPEFSGGKIIRNVLPIPGNPLPFAWDQKASKLYLDFNRNLDLTDDPGNVFSSSESGRYQEFRDIPIGVAILDSQVPYDVGLQFNDYKQLTCFVNIINSWQGMIDLPGIKIRMNVCDNMNGEITFDSRARESDTCSVVPLDFKDHPSSFTLESFIFPKPFPVKKKIFLGGSGYDLDFAFVKQEKAVLLKAIFREMKPETGILRITGDYIKQADLSGDFQTILYSPAREEKIPAGKYTQCRLSLQKDSQSPEFQTTLNKPFTMNKDEVYLLEAGGPLDNKVSVSRSGSRLNLSQELVGIGGESYTRFNIDYQNPPEFVVYQDGKKIFSDKFAYG